MMNIILDTDIGPDCDDVAALAMLNLYARDGLCRILGIGHCTSSPYGAGCIDAICRYYGHDDVPIGTFKGEGFLVGEAFSRYNRHLMETMPNRYREHQPEDAVTLYRRLLSQAEDGSVEFISIGPLNNLANLLNSPADEVSPLNGVELVRRKVRRLTAMAGAFPSQVAEENEVAFAWLNKPAVEMPEFNVKCDLRAAQRVAEEWPTEKVYLGVEAGMVDTCAPLQQTAEEGNPVRVAYRLYTGAGRLSWDLLTVEYAVHPEGGLLRASEKGRVSFDDRSRTIWTPDPQGDSCFLEWNKPAAEIADYINTLLARSR